MNRPPTPRRPLGRVSFVSALPGVVLLACGGGGATPSEPAEPAVASIELTAELDTLFALGMVVTVEADVRDQDGARLLRNVEWRSSAPAVAPVDASGRVTARSNGSATLTARAGSVSATLDLVVAQRVASVRLTSPRDTALTPGVRLRFGAEVLDPFENPVSPDLFELEWSTSDAAVATVDTRGRVRPLRAGRATIRARAGDALGTLDLAVAATVPLQIDPDLAERLRWALEDTLAAYDVRGVGAAVSLPDGRVWTAAAGRSTPGRQLHPLMGYSFASVTKTVVAGVVHRLVEEGVLSYDDTVADWLDDQPNVDGAATVRQLLTHAGGYADYAADPGLWPATRADPQRWWTPEEIVEAFVGPPLHAPGTATVYTNTHFLVLGQIVTAATGAALSEEMRRLLWDPLALEATVLGGEEELRSDMAAGWTRFPGTTSLQDFRPFLDPGTHSIRWAAGGVISTPSDMARWTRALHGGELLGDEALELLTRFAPTNTGNAWTGIGHGTLRYDLGGTTWGHSGAVRGFSSLAVYDPVHEVSVVAVVNQDDATHPFVHFRVVRGLLDILRGDGG